jgi:hypothetical protein
VSEGGVEFSPPLPDTKELLLSCLKEVVENTKESITYTSQIKYYEYSTDWQKAPEHLALKYLFTVYSHSFKNCC